MATVKMLANAMLFAVLGACGGPVLQNVPRPNTAAVAGVAAGAAAALTLADPAAAAKRQEARAPDKSLRPKRTTATVPADVLDRLDEQQPDAAPATPAPPPPETSEISSPVPLR